MISIKNLTAGYGAKTILKDLNVQAGKGQFIALLGPNGSGKSTLLKAISGIIEPNSGQIEVGGLNIRSLSRRARAKMIAYLTQGREAAPGLEVSDILEIGRAPFRGRLGKLSSVDGLAIERAASRTEVERFKTRKFETLSGGEQARVLLARALALEAPVLLADEPIAALDPFYQISTMEILQEEARSGKLVIAALHDLALASQFADQVWLLSEGLLAAAGPPQDALTAKTLKAVFNIEPPKGGLQQLRRFQE